MHSYSPKEFNLPSLEGLSDKQVEVHLGLYKGYVKHVNHIREQITELSKEDYEKHAYTTQELRRRLSFEFNGMRMHEYYFEQFEEGSAGANQDGAFAKSVSEKYGSWDGFMEHLQKVAASRGIGWVTVVWDEVAKQPHTIFVGDHEIGQLGGQPILLAIDMWEHAFMVDYTPAEKKQYLDAVFNNLNWSVAEGRLS